MIGIVFVSSLMIALRVLGRIRVAETFRAVWQGVAPWRWTALAVMSVTGLILVIGEPIREFTTLSFWLKMALVAIGVTSTALFGRAVRQVAAASVPAATVPAAQVEFSPVAKTSAVVLIVIWLAIIFLGRAIAYDDEV